ncbi:MAG TPA: hypothetical protein ENJ37_08735 [Deltaproteobacteria bacterium]|nr:hypothetical protein [Deltaproteobacteria bacterium]
MKSTSKSKIIKVGYAEAEKIEPFVPGRLDKGGAAAPPADDDLVGGPLGGVEREAYEKGFEAGEKAGFELGRQKAEAKFGSLDRLIEELASLREELYRACESEIVALVMTIARKVVHRELETSEASIVSLVKEALRATVTSGTVVVRLNPRDAELLMEHAGSLGRFGDGSGGLRIESDAAITRGGCIVETAFGEVDATVEGLLADIEERLTDEE